MLLLLFDLGQDLVPNSAIESYFSIDSHHFIKRHEVNPTVNQIGHTDVDVKCEPNVLHVFPRHYRLRYVYFFEHLVLIKQDY